MKKLSITLLGSIIVLAGLLATADAATFTITLDDAVASECGDEFSEIGLTLRFEQTTSEDLTYPYCFFIADANNFGLEGVYIYPARLVVDLSGVEGLETVEVDVYETHFAGSTRAFLYDEGTMVNMAFSSTEDLHTLTLYTGGSAVDRLAISAHESYVFEIRLIGAEITPNGPTSFGGLKSIYR